MAERESGEKRVDRRDWAEEIGRERLARGSGQEGLGRERADRSEWAEDIWWGMEKCSTEHLTEGLIGGENDSRVGAEPSVEKGMHPECCIPTTRCKSFV